jgi:hypothetical protein
MYDRSMSTNFLVNKKIIKKWWSPLTEKVHWTSQKPERLDIFRDVERWVRDRDIPPLLLELILLVMTHKTVSSYVSMLGTKVRMT